MYLLEIEFWIAHIIHFLSCLSSWPMYWSQVYKLDNGKGTYGVQDRILDNKLKDVIALHFVFSKVEL